MTETPERGGPSEWQSGPLVAWLLEEGRLLGGVDETVDQLGQRMLSAGAPLWRLRLSMRTLHPLIAAFSSVWERDADDTAHIETPHGLEGRSGFIGSPLEIIGRTGAAFRKRLSEALSAEDHNVLHELKARGATDYFGLPLRYNSGTSASLVFTTDAAGGFSVHDIHQFTEIAAVLAPVAEVFSTQRIARAVAEAYLGPRTGRRVLDGQITRGDIEKIEAAILVGDIRDWSGLNARLPAEEAVALANRYFEIVAQAVEAEGGEILKFIGDGVLAVFPADEQGVSPEAACQQALSAARHALQNAQAADPPLDLRFGTGLHFGEVLYGNIGSQTRIDFTVLGQAVNIAARIEGLCSRLDEPILFSEAFAARLDEPTSVVADEALKGHDGTFRILAATPI